MSNIFELKDIYIESDDDTYFYGDNTYQAQYCKETDTYFEPYILNNSNDNEIIKFYRSKKFFAIYKNNNLIKIIKVMTCWSDDYKIINIKDNCAYNYTETSKGQFRAIEKPCNIDYCDFIAENGL